jgi:predicted phosphodiesterase
MRIAALYDIHGNLPALEAVLAEVHREHVDVIVVGGDVLPGPMPRETLDCLLHLDVPVRFLYGNGERAVLAQLEAANPADVTYWGTTSGAPLPEPLKEVVRWTARETREYRELLADWPGTVTLAVPELGEVLFCHGTPRSETEVFTRRTAEERLLPLFEPLGVSMIVCGHTHMQFDRMVDKTRVVNAGSVGMPFGTTDACWLLLGSTIALRRTRYDLPAAAERIRATTYPGADEFAANYILQSPSEEKILNAFAAAELT